MPPATGPEHYDVDDVVPIRASFRNAAGTAADPTTVVARVKDPAGTIITYTYGTDAALVKDGVGEYHVDVAVGAQVGRWYYRFKGTGTVAVSEENYFIVDPSEFAPSPLGPLALCTIRDVKETFGTRGNDDDFVIADHIEAASVAIIERSGREFKTATSPPHVRQYDIVEARQRELRVGDWTTVTGLRVLADTGTALATPTGFVALPRVRASYEPIEAVRLATATVAPSPGTVLEVTGTAGFPKVPDDVRRACVILVGMTLRRDVTQFSATFSLDENRVELPNEFPRQVQQTIDRWRKRRGPIHSLLYARPTTARTWALPTP